MNKFRPDLFIRKMQEDDLDVILEIESTCFPFAWSRDVFIAELDKSYGCSFSAFFQGNLAGYALGWKIATEIHIANLAVHPEYRNNGLGTALIMRLIKEDSELQGAFLEVRQSNIDAIKLYEKLGFERIGIHEKYYFTENEDAILMRKDLTKILKEGEFYGLV